MYMFKHAFQTSRVSLEHEFASLHGRLKKGAARALSFRREETELN